MKKNFKHQKLKPITKEILDKLEGNTLYSDYKIGDEIFVFMELSPSPDSHEINLVLHTITEKDFELFGEDYEFVEMKTPFPIFEKRKE